MYVNELARTVSLSVYSNGTSFNTGSVTLHSEAIPSKYRPHITVTSNVNGNAVQISVNNSGAIYANNVNGKTLTNYSYYINLNWNY